MQIHNITYYIGNHTQELYTIISNSQHDQQKRLYRISGELPGTIEAILSTLGRFPRLALINWFAGVVSVSLHMPSQALSPEELQTLTYWIIQSTYGEEEIPTAGL